MSKPAGLKEGIAAAVAVATYVFGVRGGFLEKIAPPEASPARSVADYAFLGVIVIVLLVLAVSANISKFKFASLTWLVAGIALAGSTYFLYEGFQTRIRAYTYACTVRGKVFIHVRGVPTAKTLEEFERVPESKTNPCRLNEDLPSDQIWTGTEKNLTELETGYFRFVLCLTAAMFVLVQAAGTVVKKPE